METANKLDHPTHSIQGNLIPVENIDIFEDSRLVISRLFYVMPQLQGDRLDCQIFYEDNVFRKGRLGRPGAGELHPPLAGGLKPATNIATDKT